MERCDHCGRITDTPVDAGGMRVCGGETPGRPNCHRLVAEFGHRADCAVCKLAGVAVRR